jgi:hypothetical protein
VYKIIAAEMINDRPATSRCRARPWPGKTTDLSHGRGEGAADANARPKASRNDVSDRGPLSSQQVRVAGNYGVSQL